MSKRERTPAAAASSSSPSSGVGQLVFEKPAPKKRASPKKRKQSEEEEGEDEETQPKTKKSKSSTKKKGGDDDDEMDDASTPKSKKAASSKKKKKDDDDTMDEDDDAPKKKRGGSSVDTSKPLTKQQELHELYMTVTVAELNKMLALNNISGPSKSKAKDRLAWFCAYGEILGAPVGKCPRCLQGKLKPKLKDSEIGTDVVKGVTKWTCPGYFDEETDALKFCNKAFTTDGSEVKTTKFKGLITKPTADDIKELEERKQLARQEREEIRAHRDDASEGSREGSREGSPTPRVRKGDTRPDAVKRGTHSHRLSDPSEGDFPSILSDPHSSASSAAPNAPHVKKVAYKPGEKQPDLPATLLAEKKAAHQSHEHKRQAAAAASSSESKSPTSSTKPVCRYDPGCYRISAAHLSEFSHPGARNQKKEEEKKTLDEEDTMEAEGEEEYKEDEE